MTWPAFLSSPIPLALIAAALFGVAINIAQQGLRVVATLPGAVVANLSASLLFWGAAPFYWDSEGLATLPLAVFVLVGLFFPAGVTVLMLASNRRIGPSTTAILSGTTPLFAYVGAVLFLGEAIVAQGLLGTAAIVVGVAILAWRRPSAQGGFPLWAFAIPMSAALVRAFAQVLTKFGLALWPNAFAAILIAYTASTSMIAALLLVRGESCPRVPELGWFVLSGLTNGLAVLAMFAAFRDGDVTVVAPIVATAPLVTLVVSALTTRGDTLSARLVAGVLVTLAGVALILLR